MARARIKNRERLRSLLKALPQKQREEIKIALRQEANAIVQMQKQLVPVDEGETRDSIKAQSGLQAGEAYARVRGRARVQDPELTMIISAGNPVSGNTTRSDAHLLEFGTSSMPRKPFFFPAFRAHKRDAVRRINRAVRKAIKNALAAVR